MFAFTRTASKNIGPDGVTVNMDSGGLLRTPDASAATPDAIFDAIAAMTPLGQVTTPNDLAQAAFFFASPSSRAMIVKNLIVDGGLFAARRRALLDAPRAVVLCVLGLLC